MNLSLGLSSRYDIAVDTLAPPLLLGGTHLVSRLAVCRAWDSRLGRARLLVHALLLWGDFGRAGLRAGAGFSGLSA